MNVIANNVNVVLENSFISFSAFIIQTLLWEMCWFGFMSWKYENHNKTRYHQTYHTEKTTKSNFQDSTQHVNVPKTRQEDLTDVESSVNGLQEVVGRAVVSILPPVLLPTRQYPLDTWPIQPQSAHLYTAHNQLLDNHNHYGT